MSRAAASRQALFAVLVLAALLAFILSVAAFRKREAAHTAAWQLDFDMKCHAAGGLSAYNGRNAVCLQPSQPRQPVSQV